MIVVVFVFSMQLFLTLTLVVPERIARAYDDWHSFD